MDLPKIFVFPEVPDREFGDCVYVAVAEDGAQLAWHVSSSEGFGKMDMGLTSGPTGAKHQAYRSKYPNGYDLVWVKDWRSHPVLNDIAARNKVPWRSAPAAPPRAQRAPSTPEMARELLLAPSRCHLCAELNRGSSESPATHALLNASWCPACAQKVVSHVLEHGRIS